MSEADGTFGHAEMSRALGDITNISGSDAANKDKAAVAPAHAVGWVPRTDFDYKVYNATTREELEAVEGPGQAPTWAANAEKYEWQEEYGDVGPPHPILEKQLFGQDYTVRSGDQFAKLKEIAVLQEGEQRINPVRLFADAGLHPVMLKNIELCHYDVPTPIQAYCLPAILKGHDIVAWSGKTAAFLIPTLSKLMGKAKKLAAPRPHPNNVSDEELRKYRAEPLMLIVAPTRELATQIFDEARRFCYRSMLRPCVVYGGVPVREQMHELKRGCDVLIGTPGRLLDFMRRADFLSLHRLKYTIIDEADEMLQDDWNADLKQIMAGGRGVANSDGDRVYMMFSATFPKEARDLARDFMARDHVRIRVGRAGSTTDNIKQRIVYTDDDKKRQALHDLITSAPPTRTIIFVNSKRTADFLDDYLFNLDFPSTSIHADRTQREREDALNAFRKGKAPILIATGLSARGLDISNVMHVINYDLPSGSHGGIQEYIHRIGRTARIGNVGMATSFYNERNDDIAEVLVKVLLETKQEVPEFLESWVPEGAREDHTKIGFEDDSDSDSEDEDEDGDAEDEGVALPAEKKDVPDADTWNAEDTGSVTGKAAVEEGW
ncbi:MAG: hypothetical protein M1838_000564 [Thelocarpon superellum]|nr:MAG: hypothetical protein M1838_000564 [Thelocarpon superellum]